MTFHRISIVLIVAVVSPPRRLAADEKASAPASEVRVSDAICDGDGFLVHEVTSQFQAGPSELFFLLPDCLPCNRRLPVLYVLPVEAKDGSRYGHGLREVQQRNLHNKYGVICVMPTFSHLPWYADHPSDPAIRQESYLLKVVLPAVEQRYAVCRQPSGRWLVGFSKSGWGAFSLLLRHPEVFGRAAAWDAPFAMQEPRFGFKNIVGTQENFDEYRIPALLQRQAEHLRCEARLGVFGFGNFRADHQQLHAQLKGLKVPHVYRDGPRRKHDWHSGWLDEAVQFLADPDCAPARPRSNTECP